MSKVLRASYLMVAIAGAALAAIAQEAPLRQMRALPPASAARQAKLPYTAEFKTTRVQTLADGSTITHESTEVMVRDAQGRTVTVRTAEAGPDASNTRTTTTLYDPATRTSTTWSAPGLRLDVTTNSAQQPRTACAANVMRAESQLQTGSDPIKPVSEDLGKQTFLGVEARGHRTTTTFPAGSIGNSNELVRTYETWFSSTPGLAGINVRQVNDDPQSGHSLRELTKFTAGDPDPSLFQPPDGLETVTHEMHEEVRCP
jgi:hypothetical protein